MSVTINGSTGITFSDGSSLNTSAIFLNNQTISQPYTVATGTSGSMTGPIYLSATLTIAPGARAVIL
jgi:hypothetical protein